MTEKLDTKKEEPTRSKVYADYYPYAVPFNPAIGMDVFSPIEIAPEVADVDKEFKQVNCYNNNVSIMKSGVEFPYTEAQLIELQKCADDILYFIVNYCQIVTLKHGVQKFKLFQYQKNAIKIMHENRFSIFKFPRQMGKALWEYTLILTIHGYKWLKDIEVGDFVYDENHNPTQVTHKTERMENRECFKITFSNGETVIADANHEWKYQLSYDDPIIGTTYDMYNAITENDICIPCNVNNDVYIINIEHTESVPVYCIQVESPSHLFLITEGLIPTHNCVIDKTNISVRINGTEIDLTIGQLYDLIDTENMVESYTPNNDYEILTEQGFKPFDGITTRFADTLLEITTNQTTIKVTPEHDIKLFNGEFEQAKNLKVGDLIGIETPHVITVIKELTGEFKVADMISVKDTRSFAVNDMSAILSNCIDGESMITLFDNHTKEIFDIHISELYDYLLKGSE